MKNIKEVIVLMCCLSLIFPAPAVFAAPQGGKVVGGSANIHQSGTTTTINQSSDRAIINWHSFDIGKNEAVRHNMPSTKSAGLHRVVGGGGASQIQGLLQSNGNIYLVNPAGVVIHKGARVDTNSFIATTRDIADSNFMKGKMVFDRPGRPGAQIINQGTISVKESGLAALVAPTVRNEGLIAGKLGKVALASGDSTWKLDMHGDDLITFTVNENDVNALHAADGTPLAGAGVENSGFIKAEGGVVVLTAAQLDGIVGSVVNSGEVSAASAEVKGGKITFRGEGSHVDVRNTGIVDVSSAKADGGAVRMVADGAVASSGAVAATGGQKGGKAVLTGRDVALTGRASIDVSGATGGGTALVGGNALGKGPERNARTAKVESGAVIHADAKSKGDGGQVVVWSDEKTIFDGAITAKGGREGGNGGMVETSGKSLKVGDTARVNTSAPQGKAGQWLLDPVDFTIAASGGDMTGATVSANLEMGDVTIRSEDGQGGSNGNINVNDKIEWFSNFGLTLDAENSVNVNNNIVLHGDYSSLNIITLPSGHIYIDTGSYNINKGKVSFLGKDNKYFINGNDYKLIKTIEELQNLDVNHDFYALARDIDASSTKIWNGGSGFVPLEGVTGALNGGNHVIKGLYINSPDKNSVGLVGWTRFFMVDNLGLLDVNITGHSDVGGLIGTAYGSDVRIRNVGVTGSVAGVENVGGVLGKYSPSSGEIYRSYSTANVSGHSNVGGFAGYLNRGVWGSYSSGDVSGQNNVGGFVGCANVGNFAFSYSTGNILGNPSVAGGFVGYAENSRFQECYSTGALIPYNINWKHGFMGDGKNVSANKCYVDSTSSHSSGDPLNGNGVFGVNTAYMKSGNVFGGYPWVEDGINYPKLDIYTFASNEGGDNPPSPDPAPTPDPDPAPTPDPDPAPTPEITLPIDKPNSIYIKDNKIYWIIKDGDRISTDENGNTIIIRADETFIVPDETIFIVSTDNDSDNIDHETKLGDDKNIISEEKFDTNNTQNENSEKRIDRLINEIKTTVDQAVDSLYDEFYTLLKENIEEVNDATSQALNNIKVQLKFMPLSLGTSKTLPDDVYRAIAEAILEAMGASKVEKYADNLNEFNKQLYSMVKGGSLNKTYITKINGITYTINLQAFLYGGVGFSGNPVQWKDANNKTHSGYVYWASSPSETMSAISEYCLALSKINTKAWTEAASYFLTGTPDSKIVSLGSKVVEALCATNAGKALAETIGTEFKKEYKSGLFGLGNTFKEFVKQLPGGEKLVKIAETISKVNDVCTKTITQINKINDLKNNFENFSNDSADIVNLVNLLSSEYNFSTTEVKKLSQKITELENIYKQEKTEKLNDLPE